MPAASSATGMVSADWNGFNVLHRAAGRVAGLDLAAQRGFVDQAAAEPVHAGYEIAQGLGHDEIGAVFLERFDRPRRAAAG